MVLRPVSSQPVLGTAAAPAQSVVSTPELDEFASESAVDTIVAPAPVPVPVPAAFSDTAPAIGRRSGSLLVWALAAIALVEAPFAVMWARDAWAGTARSEGQLRIETTPAGVEVRIDGEVKGATPLQLAVTPGAHTVELREGNAWRAVPVTVAAGANVTHSLALAAPGPAAGPTAGSLQITTEPARAVVLVDGVERGRSPLLVPDLAAGEHQIVVQLPNETQRRTIRVEPGATASLIVTAGAAPAAASGWLAFASRVPLQIFDSGRLIGSTDLERLMLPVGRYDLEFVSEPLGFRARRAVTVTGGQTSTVRLELPVAPLRINAQPWAEVWVDGEAVGQTPIGDLSRPIGSHEIVFRHPQFGERRMTAVVTLKEPARVAVDLRRP